MTHSLNEIENMVRKASVGAGLPVGLAEDIGRAAAWLAARGQDGVGAALVSLQNAGSAVISPVSGKDGVTFSNAAACLCGASAVDLALAGNAGFCVHLLGVDSPLLIVGLAGLAATSAGCTFEFQFANGGKIRVAAMNFTQIGPTPTTGESLVMTCRANDIPGQQDDYVSAVVEVDSEKWRAISALASRTYVPASAASRAKGAGAGITDND